MCGIVGGTAGVDQQVLDRMLRVLKDRGPDGEGSWRRGGVFLGNTRLAVIAPQAITGPYKSLCGQIELVANGEIYNEPALRKQLELRGHLFQTQVDTEVLIHAYREWGLPFLERVDGIFAFILIDISRDRFIAARDPLGVKPLFWRRLGEGVVYASTCAALSELSDQPLDVCPHGLMEHLYRQSITPPRTIFRQIGAVEAGTAHICSLRNPMAGPRVERYYSLDPKYDPAESFIDKARVTQRLDDTLSGVCYSQSRSDRAAALALSGGIDSGLIASYNRPSQVGERAVYLRMQGDCAEFQRAQSTAVSFGKKLEALDADGQLEDSADEWIGSADHPPADGFNTYLLCRAVRDSTVVLYSGLGADELFGGYPELTRLSQGRDHGALVAHFFRATALVPRSVLDRVGAELSIEVDNVVSPLVAAGRDLAQRLARYHGAEILRQLLIRYYLSPCLLSDADSYSMCQGVELRVPFLGRPMVDFALSTPNVVPEAGKVQVSKPLLRALAMLRRLPSEVTSAPKQGFALPYETLTKRFAPSSTVQDLPADHRATPYRVWALFATGTWLKRHGMELTAFAPSAGEPPGGYTTPRSS